MSMLALLTIIVLSTLSKYSTEAANAKKLLVCRMHGLGIHHGP